MDIGKDGQGSGLTEMGRLHAFSVEIPNGGVKQLQLFIINTFAISIIEVILLLSKVRTPNDIIVLLCL